MRLGVSRHAIAPSSPGSRSPSKSAASSRDIVAAMLTSKEHAPTPGADHTDAGAVSRTAGDDDRAAAERPIDPNLAAEICLL